MTVVSGKIHHEDGSYTLALAESKGGDENLETVVSFPEPGGTYAIAHNVPRGTEPGEFSS